MSIAMDLPAGATCPTHPDAEAVGLCERCGAFYCADCVAIVAGRRLCRACVERPGVDYLGDLKRKLWGRRDGYVWWFGVVGTLTGLANLALGIVSLLGPQDLAGMTALVMGLAAVVVFGSYLLLRPWARWGLFGYLALLLLLAGASGARESGVAVGGVVLPFLFFVSALRSARNRLAFGIEVGETEMKKLYEAYYDNAIARWGLMLSLFSLIVPGLELVSLPLSVAGLKRVDPDAWPPIGRKKTAIAGIALSILGLAGTVLTIWMTATA